MTAFAIAEGSVEEKLKEAERNLANLQQARVNLEIQVRRAEGVVMFLREQLDAPEDPET